MTRQQVLDLVVPTPVQWVAFPMLSFLILVILYFNQLVAKFTHSSASLSVLTQVNYQEQLAKYLDNNLVGNLVTVLFWSLIGLIAYTAVWLGTNAVINARNEVVVETAYTNKGPASGRLRVVTERIAVAILFLSFVAFSGVVLLPIWLHAFGNFVAQPLGFIAGLWLVFAVVGLAANGYIVLTLGQVVFHQD